MPNRPRLKTPFDTPPAPAAEPPPAGPPSRRGRLRFGVRTFLGLTFVLGVASAGYGAMTQSGDNLAFYVLFALMTPLLALGAAALFHRVVKWRRRRRPTDDGRGPFDD